MAQKFALADLEEARRYYHHPLLGPRLVACAHSVLPHTSKTAREIFGAPDDLKFRSSITLFHAAAPEASCFTDALDIFFNGVGDPYTVERLQSD